MPVSTQRPRTDRWQRPRERARLDSPHPWSLHPQHSPLPLLLLTRQENVPDRKDPSRSVLSGGRQPFRPEARREWREFGRARSFSTGLGGGAIIGRGEPWAGWSGVLLKDGRECGFLAPGRERWCGGAAVKGREEGRVLWEVLAVFGTPLGCSRMRRML